MFAIIGWIVFGLIAGVIAKALMPGKDPGGCIITILLGIAGSVIGGFIARGMRCAFPPYSSLPDCVNRHRDEPIELQLRGGGPNAAPARLANIG